MTILKSIEGKLPLEIPHAGKSCETWYKIVGNLSHGTPLVTLHGGPGAAHEYLLPLLDIHLKHGTPIIFYDQIGCGKSTRLSEKMGDEDFWTVDLFMFELDALVDHLGLRTQGFDLFGQSWGGMLGGAYAARNPPGLRRLVLADSPASVPLMLRGVQELVKGLPQSVQDDLEECQRNHDFESDKYKAACMVFYQRHLCRLDPFPAELLQGLGHLEEDPTVYRTMYGPSEIFATGPLKDWEAISIAHKIEVETLLINGHYDEVQDLAVSPWFERIRKVKWVQLAESSHMGHFEERQRYMQILGDFLTVEKTEK